MRQSNTRKNINIKSAVAVMKSQWKWTMMIMQPEPVQDAVLLDVIAVMGRKKALPALSKVRLENFAEGRCAQVLHMGPFSDEGPNI